MNTIEIIFFILLSLVFYTYLGYGIILWALVGIKRIFVKEKSELMPEELPEVTLFITAYNEEQVVDEKMQNCRELDYPKEKFKIVWVTDGSCDATNEKLKAYPDATVYYSAERKGKTAAMNRGIKFVTAPIVIFTDANTFIHPQAVREWYVASIIRRWGVWQARNASTCTPRTEQQREVKECTGNMNLF